MRSAPDRSGWFEQAFAGSRVMAILRGSPPDRTVELCRAAWAAGIAVVEIPIQAPAAVPSLQAAVAAARAEGRTVGAGTVTSPDQVRIAVEAGASFTVAPGLSPAVAQGCLDAGLPHLPGVATSSEIITALDLGFRWLKAFPAAQLTPGWFSAQLAPFPDLRLVATGGIDADNGPAFLDAGARVLAVGSALADPLALRRIAELVATESGAA